MAASVTEGAKSRLIMTAGCPRGVHGWPLGSGQEASGTGDRARGGEGSQAQGEAHHEGRRATGRLANLLNAVGAVLNPKVFCVGELADQGAGHPDFGLYAAKQVQKGRPRDGQMLDDTQSCCGALIRPSPWPADVVSTRSVRPRPAARSSLSCAFGSSVEPSPPS